MRKIRINNVRIASTVDENEFSQTVKTNKYKYFNWFILALIIVLFLLLPRLLISYKAYVLLFVICCVMLILNIAIAIKVGLIQKKEQVKSTATTQTLVNLLIEIITIIFTMASIDVPPPNILPINNKIIRDRAETITIESEDGLRIYYSIDGSDPQKAAEYHQKETNFTLNVSTTVAARTKYLFFWSSLSERDYSFIKPRVEESQKELRQASTGSSYLEYDGKVLFRKYEKSSFGVETLSGWHSDINSVKKICYLYSDGTIEELFDDFGYGPLIIANDCLYMNRRKQGTHYVYSVNLLNKEKKEYGEGYIVSIDASERYILCTDAPPEASITNKVFIIDTYKDKVVWEEIATGGIIGFNDNSFYYALVNEKDSSLASYEEYDFETKIIKLNLDTFSIKTLLSTSYRTYREPIIVNAQFVDQYLFYSYGTRDGSAVVFTGDIRKINLNTSDIEYIDIDVTEANFFVIKPNGQHFITYSNDIYELSRLEPDTRVVDYSISRSLGFNQAFEERDGIIAITDDENHARIIIGTEDYDDFGYVSGMLNDHETALFMITDIEVINDKIFFRVDTGKRNESGDYGWRPNYTRTKIAFYCKDIPKNEYILIYEIDW